jgi:integrase
LLVLGLRRRETLGLRWQDVDLDRGVVHIRQGLHCLERRLQFLPPKSRLDAQRATAPAVRRRAAGSSQAAGRGTGSLAGFMGGLVFVTLVGTPIDPNSFSRTFAAWCQTADVPTVRLHDLPRTCVSCCCTWAFFRGPVNSTV